MRICQRIEEHAIDDREKSGVRADAESQGEHSDGGKLRILAQHANGVVQILEQVANAAYRTHVAIFILEFISNTHFVHRPLQELAQEPAWMAESRVQRILAASKRADVSIDRKLGTSHCATIMA